MPHITTFDEAQKALRPLYNNTRTPYTLDSMRELMEHLGNPQNKLKVIHVAGTSGKTSTAYYIAALLHGSGAKVGLSVSPHVDTINERLQINGQLLPEAEFCAVLGEFMDVIADCRVEPSYFELLIAMTYWEFSRRGLDYAVMEVGLGGLLDCTNVVDQPDKVCVITDIGLDHTEILGDTLPEIAAQKAGIIHSQNQVFMYKQGQAVMETIARMAYKQQAILHMFESDATLRLPTLPLFQQRNLGLAYQVVKYVNQRDGLPFVQAEVVDIASQVVVPARLERFEHGDKTIILDGSHNQQKLQALLTSIAELYPGQDIAALAGFVKGNDERWQGGLSELLPVVKHIVFTSFHSEKDMPRSSVDPKILCDYCKTQDYGQCVIKNNPAEAVHYLLERPEPILLITGSFYLMNHVRPLIQGLDA